MKIPTKKTNFLKPKIFLITALTLVNSFNFTASAKYINAGNIDLKIKTSPTTFQEQLTQKVQPSQTIYQTLTIGNFSPTEKTIQLYAADAEKNHQNFTANTPQEPNQNVGNWITLPTNKLILKPNESKDLKFIIQVPKTAGTGYHYGAIIAKETTTTDSQTFHKETGLRLNFHIEGEYSQKIQITNPNLTENLFTANLQNYGKSDFHSTLKLLIKDQNNNILQTKTQKTFLRNNHQTKLAFPISNLQTNIFQYEIIDTKTNQVIYQSGIQFINLEIPILISLTTILALYLLNKKYQFLNNKLLKSSFRLITLTIISAATFYLILKLPNLTDLQASLLYTEPQKSYTTIIKWGNINKINLPKSYKQSWQGKITFENATISIKENLHLEPSDSIQIIDDNSIDFNLETGQDNDGIILQINATTDQPIILKYENRINNHQVSTNLTSTLNHPININEYPHAIQIFSEPNRITQSQSTKISEIQATTEQENSPEPPDRLPISGSNEKLLALFNELPASPEELASFIVKSNYVETINQSNSESSIFLTDPKLIKALEATPELIAEISATPELNFIFIPSTKIQLPPQTFSFRNRKISSQELGTFIFIQNKNTPWNSYVKISNFISEDGRHTIPAQNIIIDPGQPKSLSTDTNLDITPGQIEKLTGSTDPKLLFSINETTDQTVFILNPTISIEIPPNTPPGKYRSEITLTNI